MHLSFHTPIFPLGIIDDGLSNDKKLIGSGQRTPHVFLNLCCEEIFFEKIPQLLHYILYTLFRRKKLPVPQWKIIKQSNFKIFLKCALYILYINRQ